MRRVIGGLVGMVMGAIPGIVLVLIANRNQLGEVDLLLGVGGIMLAIAGALLGAIVGWGGWRGVRDFPWPMVLGAVAGALIGAQFFIGFFPPFVGVVTVVIGGVAGALVGRRLGGRSSSNETPST